MICFGITDGIYNTWSIYGPRDLLKSMPLSELSAIVLGI